MDQDTRKIRLITRGDDAGSSKSANVAIQETFEKGILRNVSVIACGEFVEHAYDCLGNLYGLSVGLHVAINSEWIKPKWGPVAGVDVVPSLVNSDGVFFPHPKETLDNGMVIDEVMVEIRAQLDYVRKVGFKVDYLDLHMGFDWVKEGLRERIVEFMAEEGLLNGYFGFDHLPAGEKGLDDQVDRLLSSLEKAESGTYLVVKHPTYDDAEMQQVMFDGFTNDCPAADRDGQRRCYLDERILDLHRRGVLEPIRFDEV